MKTRLAQCHNQNSPQENSQIQPERQLSHVLKIILPSLRPAHLSTTVNLSKTCQARTYLQALQSFAIVVGHLRGQRRSWADERHIALEDIQQLGQLVDARFAEYPADRCNARVVLDFENWARHLVQVREFVLYAIRSGNHGPEFVHSELPLVQTNSRLSEQYGTR